jgi:hypothetical protein
MIIKQLIEELSKQDPEREVMVSASPKICARFDDRGGDLIETQFAIDDLKHELNAVVIYI